MEKMMQGRRRVDPSPIEQIEDELQIYRGYPSFAV